MGRKLRKIDHKPVFLRLPRSVIEEINEAAEQLGWTRVKMYEVALLAWLSLYRSSVANRTVVVEKESSEEKV